MSSQLKSLGVIFDPRLTFEAHVSSVCKACNYHMQNCRAATAEVLSRTTSTEITTLASNISADQLKFKLATLAFMIQSTSQPEYLHQLISSQHSGSSMTLRSSTRPLLQVPHTRNAYGSRAFSSAVPAIWNNLPTSVKYT